MKRIYYSLSFFCFCLILKAQVGIGTSNPSTSAVLELNSNNKGLLFNTVSLNSTISPIPLPNHVEGMWVYNNATAGTPPNNVTEGLYYNDGSKWVPMSAEEEVPRLGDIKSSIINADHDGWYLLNGRNISTLPVAIQTNAVTLGFISQIPNSNNRIMKGKSASEPVFSVGGTNSHTLTQANLPALTFTGTTSTAGLHTHFYNNNGNTSWNHNAGSSPATLFVSPLVSRTTNSAGNHSHTISIPSGGSNTPITQDPKHLVVQYFIYLGK